MSFARLPGGTSKKKEADAVVPESFSSTNEEKVLNKKMAKSLTEGFTPKNTFKELPIYLASINLLSTQLSDLKNSGLSDREILIRLNTIFSSFKWYSTRAIGRSFDHLKTSDVEINIFSLLIDRTRDFAMSLLDLLKTLAKTIRGEEILALLSEPQNTLPTAHVIASLPEKWDSSMKCVAYPKDALLQLLLNVKLEKKESLLEFFKTLDANQTTFISSLVTHDGSLIFSSVVRDTLANLHQQGISAAHIIEMLTYAPNKLPLWKNFLRDKPVDFLTFLHALLNNVNPRQILLLLQNSFSAYHSNIPTILIGHFIGQEISNAHNLQKSLDLYLELLLKMNARGIHGSEILVLLATRVNFYGTSYTTLDCLIAGENHLLAETDRNEIRDKICKVLYTCLLDTRSPINKSMIIAIAERTSTSFWSTSGINIYGVLPGQETTDRRQLLLEYIRNKLPPEEASAVLETALDKKTALGSYFFDQRISTTLYSLFNKSLHSELHSEIKNSIKTLETKMVTTTYEP